MSENSGIRWQELFVERVKGLEKQDVTMDRAPMEEGLIAYQEERKCRNCEHTGVYSGIGIFSGHLFRSVNADYCPNCGAVNTISASRPLISTDTKRFLPVVRQRLLDFPELASESIPGPPCPECGAETHMLEINKGIINSYGHRWTVCNAGCGWPGQYEPILN